MVKEKLISEIFSDQPCSPSDPKPNRLNSPLKKKLPFLTIFSKKSSKNSNSSPKLCPEHSKFFYSHIQPQLGSRFLKGIQGKMRVRQSKSPSPERNYSNLRGSHENKIIKFNSQQDELIAEFLQESPRIQNSATEKKQFHKKHFKVLSPSSKKANPNIFCNLTSSQREAKITIDSEKFTSLKKHKSAPITLKPITNIIKTKSNKRDKALLRRFTNEFTSLCGDTGFSSTGFLNYSKFCWILNKLKFIEDSFNKSEEERELVLKAWKMLGGNEEGKVKIDNLYIFLLGIMNIDAKIDQPVVSPNSRYRRGLLSFSKKDVAKIHKEFMCFYVNRTEEKELENIQLNESNFSPDEIVSGGETPEIIVDEVKNNLPFNNEKHDDEHGKVLELPIKYPSSFKLIKRISLRKLSATPKDNEFKLIISVLDLKNDQNIFNHVHRSTQSISDNTLKNLSFNSDSEDIKIKPLLTPQSKCEPRLFINKIRFEKVKNIRNEHDSKNETNNSVSYKTLNSVKFKFPDSRDNSGILLNVSHELTSDENRKIK
ncbi:hypothetical protein SteCoe_30859 [Stentor coeruleus]|uniref:Uncharacterized protein n=1 Tax=Stentor coeruleus TaxID=5963 RepID=A0A1R2B2R7_9CILI|nr:hypothetical protein SteCoe_30859 [Stentor coeruleus]